MLGHSSTQLATCSPNSTGLPTPCAPTRGRARSASLGRRGLKAGALLSGLLGALSLGACGSGYGDYQYWQDDPATYSGRMAMSWTLNGTPLTAARCQSERIDSMAVYIASEADGQSSVEFLNVVCALSRYSVAMVPTGPVSLYVNGIHVQRDQTQCVRYAGLKHGTATAQFPENPLSIDLKLVANCP